MFFSSFFLTFIICQSVCLSVCLSLSVLFFFFITVSQSINSFRRKIVSHKIFFLSFFFLLHANLVILYSITCSIFYREVNRFLKLAFSLSLFFIFSHFLFINFKCSNLWLEQIFSFSFLRISSRFIIKLIFVVSIFRDHSLLV